MTEQGKEKGKQNEMVEVKFTLRPLNTGTFGCCLSMAVADRSLLLRAAS